MINIKKFTFNAFQVNTYVLWSETGESMIIDPGMQTKQEEIEISTFISSNNLKPVILILTHAHIDHIAGCNYIAETYSLPLTAHKDSEHLLKNAAVYGSLFGVNIEKVKDIDSFIDESSELKLGNNKLKILHTPGHAVGSVCFYSPVDKFVVTGDVLFNQSIGRTDLPTGDYDVLQKSIWEKLFVLPDETVVYSGHGPETTIGSEKINNPFVAIGR